MQHTILVNHEASAVITEDGDTVSVTCYVGETPTVAWDGTSYAEAEQWAKAVIAYAE